MEITVRDVVRAIGGPRSARGKLRRVVGVEGDTLELTFEDPNLGSCSSMGPRCNYEKADVPTPGSDLALYVGCECPVLDNAHGKGYMTLTDTFVINTTCPVHGGRATKEVTGIVPRDTNLNS